MTIVREICFSSCEIALAKSLLRNRSSGFLNPEENNIRIFKSE
jgi:hypothetical protein